MGAREAVVKTRGMLQDAVMESWSLVSHILLYGVLFCGLHLQAQVSYFNARCYQLDKHSNVVRLDEQCNSNGDLQLKFGMVSGFLSMMLTIVKAAKTVAYLRRVESVRSEYFDWYQSDALHSEGWTEDTSNQEKHDRVVSLSGRLRRHAAVIVFAVLLLLGNFFWVSVKWYMVTFVCEQIGKDKIWDVAFPLESGCVDFSAGLGGK